MPGDSVTRRRRKLGCRGPDGGMIGVFVQLWEEWQHGWTQVSLCQHHGMRNCQSSPRTSQEKILFQTSSYPWALALVWSLCFAVFPIGLQHDQHISLPWTNTDYVTLWDVHCILVKLLKQDLKSNSGLDWAGYNWPSLCEALFPSLVMLITKDLKNI